MWCCVVVLFIDLDVFKIVNDSYSYVIGDCLLVKVVECINVELGEGDVGGCIGGDEFIVLVINIDICDGVVGIVSCLFMVLVVLILVDDYEIVFSVSIGIVSYLLDGENLVVLIINVDVVMYVVKSEECNVFCFYLLIM